MKRFAQLYTALDETNKTNEKVAALVRYFAQAEPADAAWALYFLIGRRPRQAVQTPKLALWAIEAAGIPDWLFGECYDAVGDFAETVALLLPERSEEPASTTAPAFLALDRTPATLSCWIERVLLPLRELNEEQQRTTVLWAWMVLDGQQRFLCNKLITGAFRVGVSQRLVTRALAQVSGIDSDTIAHRLMGEWTPTAQWYQQLIAHDTSDADISRPYPFCLAHPLDEPLESLGDRDEWQAEWKWDGIRAQLVRRAGGVYLWSRGEELVTDRFPEIAAAGVALPDGSVIDGEIVPWRDDAVLPFGQLQRRIGRKTLTRKILGEVPVILLAYDLLELAGRDVRSEPLAWRRAQLEALLTAGAQHPGQPATIHPALQISPVIKASSWPALAETRERSRELGAEGLMLKRRSSVYRVGRQRGDWWKWKIAPYTIDAVLIYAQRGSGKRASLYTDYTFGVWEGDQLIPFAKAYSGLTSEEIRRVDAFVRQNTIERFGPVRTVKPELVFELAFEGLQRSTRHKSGIAVRFPRMLRWRIDKRPEDADTLEQVRALLPPEER